MFLKIFDKVKEKKYFINLDKINYIKDKGEEIIEINFNDKQIEFILGEINTITREKMIEELKQKEN